jgi:hypothetical protein
MINKAFDQIGKPDVSELISNAVREGRTLEYKEKLPGNSDGEKTEFLADVSSFANAAGGYILYGIREKRDAAKNPTGIPESVHGLPGINLDSEILRLESSIRTGIHPRIPGIRTKAVEGFPKGSVLLVWIPKSWSSPHMVTYKNHSRFYSRSSNGKYPLDVTELRSAFALSESLPERIRRFRDERIAKIVANETPMPLEEGPRLVLHVMPIAALNVPSQCSVSEMYEKRQQLLPIGTSDWNSHRINFDGVLTFSYFSTPATCYAYVQAFSSGAMESVDTYLLSERDGKRLIPSTQFEKDLISALDNYLGFQETLGLTPPIFVMISMLDVKDYSLDLRHSTTRPIDRNVLMLPDIIVEEYRRGSAEMLRPAFDALWQASGFLRSGNYDENGKWIWK